MPILTIKVLCDEDVELPSKLTPHLAEQIGKQAYVGIDIELEDLCAYYYSMSVIDSSETLRDLVASGTYHINLVLSKDYFIKVLDLTNNDGTIAWKVNPGKVLAIFDDGNYVSYKEYKAEPHIIYAYKEPKTFLGLESGDWLVACILGVLAIMFGLFIIAMFATVISGPPL